MIRIISALRILFVLAVPLFLITGSVTWAVKDAGLYNRGFDRYNISQSTGMTDVDLRQTGADIRHYFGSREESLNIRTRVFGVERDLFNQQEVAHMRDVKVLIRRVNVLTGLSGIYILAAVVTSFVRYRRQFVSQLATMCLWGGISTLAILLSVGLFALLEFDSLFLKFHQIGFSNDLWQLDPRTDYLLIMFPLGFWFDATMRVATTAIGGALLVASASGGYLLYRRYTAEPKEETTAPAEVDN